LTLLIRKQIDSCPVSYETKSAVSSGYEPTRVSLICSCKRVTGDRPKPAIILSWSLVRA